MLPQFPDPAPPLEFLDNKISSIRVIDCLGVISENTTSEAMGSYHTSSSFGVPGVRRCNIVVTPLLPSRSITRSNRRTEPFVDLEKSIVVVTGVVPAEATVGVDCSHIARQPIGIVGGLSSRVGIKC